MRDGRFSVLTTWPFVLALTTLIVNDAWLKGAWPGLVTGKLSDFAGIAVIALLALQRFPQRRLAVYAVIAACFAWWKGPWSQPCIDAVNAISPIAIGRTIDYTDLIGLLAMPACAVVARRQEDFALAGANVRRLLLAPIGMATVLGLMGTPAVTSLHGEYDVRTLAPDGALDRAFIANEIAKIAKYYALDCTDCAKRLDHAAFGKNLRLQYHFVDARTVKITLDAPAKGFLSNKYANDVERIREKLDARLGAIDSDRIFVIIRYGRPLEERL